MLKTFVAGAAGTMALLTAAPISAQAARPAANQPQPIQRVTFIANMDAEFRRMDADKNGTVSPAEVEGFQRATSILQIQRRNRTIFGQLDTDRNGQLSAAEFLKFETNLPPVNPAPVLAKFDLNRDSGISLVEYRTGTLVNFDRMDADKDGVVTHAELGASSAGR